MRRRLLAILLLTPLAMGCYALDLIDEGQAEMDRYSGKARAEKKAKAANAKEKGSPEEEEKLTREDLHRWWGEAKTVTSEKADSKIVRCRLGGGIQFTKKNDCLTRGGKVVRAGA